MHRSTAQWVLFFAIAIFLAIPTVPIVWAWKSIRNAFNTMPARKRLIVSCLTLQTVSVFFIILGIIHSRWLGMDYSSARFTLIWVWFGLSFLTTFSVFVRSPIRVHLLVAGVWLTLDWLYFAVVSSVV